MSGAIGDDDDIGSIGPFGNEPSYVASLGRISGKLLSANLLRNGTDLTFRNAPADADLLYLNVTDKRIGINTDAPLYDLQIDTDVRTTILEVTNQARIDNIIISATGTFSSYTGPIIISTSSSSSITVLNKLRSDYIEIYNNRIDSISNNNIKLDPNGTGRVIFGSNVSTVGNVGVTGNIVLSGDLRSNGVVTIGDNILDTVTVNTDFTQSIIPGTDITYDLGKSNKRWAELNSPVWQEMDNILPQAVRVSDQTLIDGVNNKISGIQSNEDILLLPDTGVVNIEQTKWETDNITNMANTALRFASTGIGYLKIVGTNAVLIPAGDNASRPATPEVGDTRWNTEIGYLECFDGNVYVIATGGGEEVTNEIMEDLGNVWSLVLG